MAQQQFAGIAVLIALAFLALAVSACANSEHAADAGPAVITLVGTAPAHAEFHGADIGPDTLRGRLQGP